jgi:hypothetical protein
MQKKASKGQQLVAFRLIVKAGKKPEVRLGSEKRVLLAPVAGSLTEAPGRSRAEAAAEFPLRDTK